MVAAMHHVAHVCPRCEVATIFEPEATHPRRCARCHALLRLPPVRPVVALRPTVDHPTSRAWTA